MRVKEDAHWQQMAQDLTVDGQTGQVFLTLVQAWCELAEEIVAHHPEHTPVEAIRLALAPLQGQYGHITAGFVGQLLNVIVQHWEWGAELADGLTPIEMGLVQDTLAIKLANLRGSAQVADQPSG